MYYIYIIQNKINNKIYVGQTNNIKRRWGRHKYEAFTKNNQKPLYRSMRKHGIDNFSLIEIESCDQSNVDELEMFWIEFFQSQSKIFGYNLSQGGKPLADSNIIKTRKPPMLGKKHSKQTRQKMSKDRIGDKNGFYGKTHSSEAKQKMSTNPNRKFIGKQNYFYGKSFKGSQNKLSKLNEEIVLAARKLYKNGMTFVELSKLYNVSESAISRAVRKITWNHV